MLLLFLGIVSTYFVITYIDRKDFTSPSFLLAASFLMAALIFVWNIDNWQLVIYGKTNWYVITAMISFSIGTITIRVAGANVNLADHSENVEKGLRGRNFFGLALISIVCGLMYLVISFQGSESLLNISQLLSDTYNEATSTNKGNFLLTQMKEIPVSIAYVATFFILMSNEKGIKIKKKWLIVSIASFLVVALFTTDRNIILRYVIYLVCLWILFYKNRACVAERRKNRTIIKRVLIIVVVSSIGFYGLGKAKQYTSDFERMIGLYGGSGLYNYNISIENNEPLKYGAVTFKNLEDTVNAILGNKSNEVSHGEFISFESDNGYIYSSNIYSALKPYTADFGYFGVILFPFVLGLFFEFLFCLTKWRTYGFSWVFYAMSVYSLLYFSIQEQFFSRFHLGRLYEIFWIVFFYYVTLKNPIRVHISYRQLQSKHEKWREPS